MFKFCAPALVALGLASAAQATVVDATVSIAGGGSWVVHAGGGAVGDNSFDTDGVFYTMDEGQGGGLAAPRHIPQAL